MSSPAENGRLATTRRTVWSSLDNLQRRAMVPDGVGAVLWTPSSNNEWGGTLWEVAVLAGIGGDLWSYRGLAASVDVLVRRQTEEDMFAAIVGVPVNIDSHVFRRIGQP